MARTGKTLFQNCEAYTVQQYGNRTEWLRGRSGGIGGSDAAAAIGRSPWRTNYELWLIKTGRKQAEDISDSELVRYGTKAEDPLRKLYVLDHPYFEIQHQKDTVLISKADPFLRYSPDGLILDRMNRRKGILEVKTTTIMKSFDREKWGTKEDPRIPDQYYIQVLHGLLVTGFDFIELTAQLKYDPEYKQIRTYHIERAEVEDDLQALKEAETEFWQHVQEDTAPGLILPEI